MFRLLFKREKNSNDEFVEIHTFMFKEGLLGKLK